MTRHDYFTPSRRVRGNIYQRFQRENLRVPWPGEIKRRQKCRFTLRKVSNSRVRSRDGTMEDNWNSTFIRLANRKLSTWTSITRSKGAAYRKWASPNRTYVNIQIISFAKWRSNAFQLYVSRRFMEASVQKLYAQYLIRMANTFHPRIDPRTILIKLRGFKFLLLINLIENSFRPSIYDRPLRISQEFESITEANASMTKQLARITAIYKQINTK